MQSRQGSYRPTRRALLFAVAASALTTSPRVRAQGTKLPRVVLVMQNAEEVTAPWIDSSREGMREAGQVEGKTYVLDLYFARLDPVRSEALHRQAVAERPDVLVGGGLTAARLARSLTSSIPIVIATASDLVAAGVVASEVIR